MQARTASAHSSGAASRPAGLPRYGRGAALGAAGRATAVKLQTKLMAESFEDLFRHGWLSKTEGTIKHVSEEP